MNQYFTNGGESLARTFENDDESDKFLNYLGERSDDTFKFEPINVSDLQVVFSSIRNTSPG